MELSRDHPHGFLLSWKIRQGVKKEIEPERIKRYAGHFFFDQKKSPEIHWTRYNDWKKFNGLLLPNSLSWYKYENGLPTKLGSVRGFINVTVSPEPFADEAFIKPPGTEVVQ